MRYIISFEHKMFGFMPCALKSVIKYIYQFIMHCTERNSLVFEEMTKKSTSLWEKLNQKNNCYAIYKKLWTIKCKKNNNRVINNCSQPHEGTVTRVFVAIDCVTQAAGLIPCLAILHVYSRILKELQNSVSTNQHTYSVTWLRLVPFHSNLKQYMSDLFFFFKLFHFATQTCCYMYCISPHFVMLVYPVVNTMITLLVT